MYINTCTVGIKTTNLTDYKKKILAEILNNTDNYIHLVFANLFTKNRRTRNLTTIKMNIHTVPF